jgi:NADH-quinone oxidoreductase subunit J
METVFYIAATIAIVATILTITRLSPIHALLYLIISLLAVAIVFYVLGAPFIAALEVIIYAGAIMVLFVFVVMMLNLGQKTVEIEREWLSPGIWTGPAILAIILIGEVAFLLITRGGKAQLSGKAVDPKQVAIALYQPYLLGVELASFLLMAGLVGAYHIGLRPVQQREEEHGADTHEPRSAPGGDLVHAGADRSSRAS